MYSKTLRLPNHVPMVAPSVGSKGHTEYSPCLLTAVITYLTDLVPGVAGAVLQTPL